jgi:hypothetical protein
MRALSLYACAVREPAGTLRSFRLAGRRPRREAPPPVLPLIGSATPAYTVSFRLKILISGVLPRGPKNSGPWSRFLNDRSPEGQERPTMLLARAFDLAWERYYTAGQERTVSKQVATRQLATFVVEMLRSGVRERKKLWPRAAYFTQSL